MAEDPGTGPDDPVDTEPQRLRQPAYRNALPAPRSFPHAVPLAPPSPVIDKSADQAREAPADVVVSLDCIYVTIEVPGASRETIDVEATDRRLLVTARDTSGFVHHREIVLPETVDAKSIQATYRNGVLDVALLRGTTRRIPFREDDRHG